nr:MAG TPA: restriction alleviation protein [Bacteriophage sp.]
MMKSDCDRCIHADYVLNYGDGEDMFVCDIEDELTDEDVECANEDKCPHYICANEFEPCPMCGKGLTVLNIAFMDDEGYMIGDMDNVKDFTDLCNPINAIPDGEEYTEDERKDRIDFYLNELLYGIEYVQISCPCGFTFFSKMDYDLHDKGWFEQFKKEANRRTDHVSDLY